MNPVREVGSAGKAVDMPDRDYEPPKPVRRPNAGQKVTQEPVADSIPAFTERENQQFIPIPEDLRQSFDHLEIKVRGKNVSDYDIKVAVLDRLASILDPSISEVLESVKLDVKTLKGAA